MPHQRYELQSTAIIRSNAKRDQAINLAAYYKAEKDGFREDPKTYWCQAAREYDEQQRSKTKKTWEHLIQEVGVRS